MKLLELSVTGFGGAPDGTYSFRSPAKSPLDLAIITGRVASGKTWLLRAIAASMQGVGSHGPPPNFAKLRRAGVERGQLATTWALSPAEVEAAGLDAAVFTAEVALDDQPLRLFPHPIAQLFREAKVELFPASRRLPLGWLPATTAALDEPSLRLVSPADKYEAIEQTLVELAARDGIAGASRLARHGIVTSWEQPDSLAGIKRGLAVLAPWLRFVGVQAGKRPTLCFERDDGRMLELCDLSDAEQQVLLFATMFDRLALEEAIVLIDEPVLYLHSELHVAFLEGLQGLGAGNQLIVATGSRDILGASAPAQILRLG